MPAHPKRDVISVGGLEDKHRGMLDDAITL